MWLLEREFNADIKKEMLFKEGWYHHDKVFDLLANMTQPVDNASRPFSNILCQLKSTKLLNHEKQHFLNGFKLIALAYHTTDDTLEQGMSPTQMS